ncbi:TonB-dependent receptor plug domain-containing protein [Roseovarius sp. S1116L3]|uniref:TonB-dependent receptor plug domain-containing protein n=1 Tax=Roseovarius roseus TaxID=3342636 RepID=UPI00372BF06F
MKNILLTSTILTGALATAAQAQQTYDLGTLVLSSSLTPVELGRTGATVEVVEGVEAGGNDSSVIDRLTRLPGVSSTSNGGLGANGSIQIRGLPSRYVGVRINGLDVTDPSNTQNQFNFGGLTSSGISRVEVLKGAQSALYGSEAIAGIIDVTTYRPESLGFSGEAQVEGGSFGTYSGTLSTGYRSDKGFVALSYGRIQTDGISAQSFNTEDDAFEQTTIDLTGEYAATDTLTFGGALHYRDGEVEIDRSAFSNDATGSNLFTEQGARIFATLETGSVTHTLSYSYFEMERDDPLSQFTINFKGDRNTLDYLASARLSDAATLNLGAEWTEETFSSTPGVSPFANPATSGSDETTAINAELLLSPSADIDLSAALRYDDNSNFGGKVTGRVAAAWRASEDVTFRGLIGTGYRAPSLYERFGFYGLPTLQPEESTSYEMGVEKTFGTAGFVKATLFYTDVEDLIDYQFTNTACNNGGNGCYVQIPGTTTSKGLELSGEYALTSRVTAFGAYTYVDAETDGARLTRTPKHDIVMGLSSDFTDRLSGYVDLRHVADIVPLDPANTKVDDYTLVGAGISYDVTDTAQLYLRIENLTDEDYETAGGFNQPGRAAYVGLRASF